MIVSLAVPTPTARAGARAHRRAAHRGRGSRGGEVLHVHDALGGLDRVSFQLTAGTLPHAKMMHAIERLGTGVAPLLRRELDSVTAST